MPSRPTAWSRERLSNALPPGLALTPRAARLFVLLNAEPGAWVHQKTILRQLFGGFASQAAVRMLVYATRQQLAASGDRWRIENHRKFGSYRLVDVQHERQSA
jgi:DNA-binding response OmpR family regulator